MTRDRGEEESGEEREEDLGEEESAQESRRGED